MPVLFHENATSLPSGATSMPPNAQSTYGAPTTSSIARRRNFSPSGRGLKDPAAAGTMSAAGFASVVAGRSVPGASQSSANGRGRFVSLGGAGGDPSPPSAAGAARTRGLPGPDPLGG